MKDAIAFMRWERVVPWKILSLKAYPKKRPVPVGFGSRNPEFLKQLRPGSQIWVVTKIVGQWSLAGRVVVTKLLDRDSIAKRDWPVEVFDLCEQWPFVAMSDGELDKPTSEFFETNFAEPARARFFKAKSGFGFTQSQTVKYLDGPLEDAFGECMEQGRKTVFLSYRWEEGRAFALALAKEFRNNKYSPWIDAMAIPEYIEKGAPGKSRARLEKLIRYGINHSTFAVVINTWSYGSTPWTKMELKHIRSSGKPWFQVMPSGRRCSEPTIFGRKPKAVIGKILEQQELRV